jgi:hypothetical protein
LRFSEYIILREPNNWDTHIERGEERRGDEKRREEKR